MTCLLYWLSGSEENKFNTFSPIASYAKNMSAEGGHLGWRSGSPDTILKIDHLSLLVSEEKKFKQYSHRVLC
jgi:hypothetical protein